MLEEDDRWQEQRLKKPKQQMPKMFAREKELQANKSQFRERKEDKAALGAFKSI